jgi:uncharacterized protein with ParB-like and HNH nuclease domain
MRAEAVWFAKDLLSKSKRQFQIPVFQRNYDWGVTHCSKLYSDIIDAYREDKVHFTGIVVYSRIQSGSSFDIDFIIDGQQRVTTLHILLKALYKYAEDENDVSSMDEINDYLINKHCADDMKLKLKPVKSDSDAYNGIMNGSKLKINGSNIIRNHQYFLEAIKQSLSSGLSVRDILYGIRKLHIVEVVLDKDNADNPQEIFESINSTGLDLSVADLIRNYILMVHEDQEKLYHNHWLLMEELLHSSNLSDFFKDFVTYKLKTAVKSNEIYAKFKELFKTRKYDSRTMLDELGSFAKYYAAFLDIESDYSQSTNALLREFQELKTTTPYPFFFALFDALENGQYKESEIQQVLETLIAYIVRRLIVGLPTNTYRGIFPSLYDRLLLRNETTIYEKLNGYLNELRTGSRIPRDEELKRLVVSTDLYSKRSLCKYLFMKIENKGKERVSPENLTIEHVMPQKHGIEVWRREIGPDYDEVYLTYLNTLGNLTITGYNSQLGTKSFTEKKNDIRTLSKMKTLNEDILNADRWNKESILRRADKLADILISLFPVHGLDHYIPYYPGDSIGELTMEDEDLAAHTKPRQLLLGERLFNVSSYQDVLKTLMNWLYSKYRDEMDDLARDDYMEEGSRRVFLTFVPINMKVPKRISNSTLHYESNLSAAQIIMKVRALMTVLDEPYEDIRIILAG